MPHTVRATSHIDINVDSDTAVDALSNYLTVRKNILPSNYHDYQVVSGGVGDGTVAKWTLQATKKRSRNVVATVHVAGNTITETDAQSSLVTHYTVKPVANGSHIDAITTWQGAKGIAGFFERTFAPKGLGKIQNTFLANLKNYLEN